MAQGFTKTPVTDGGGSVTVDFDLLPGTIDEFGHLVVGSVNNQIDIQFYRDTVANLTTVTTANGGTATATNGMATFSATTTASSQAKGVSPTSTLYTAGAEVYAIFTAGFTGTGAGTSYQRIGLYDTNNGFFIGREANTFGIKVRKGGSDTAVAQASFSKDKLTGAAGSRFTRNGVPEAIDLTKLNVWRIRFGWVGSAPINFEVLSPDGNWVTFHEIKQPNLAALPHINTADLPITCDAFSGNSGNALTIITNCWCAGTTAALSKLNATLTDATYAALTRSVITGVTTGGGGGYVNVKVTPSGAITTSTTLAANSGVDVGDVTINNAAGASAVNVQDGGNSLSVDMNAQTQATGNITAVDVSAGSHNPPTAGSYVEINTTGYDLAVLFFSGTYTGVNIAFEGSLDGTNWMSLYGRRENLDRWETSSGTQTNINRHLFIPTMGCTKVRVRCTVYGSGTMAVVLGAMAMSVSTMQVLSGGGDVAHDIVDIGNPVKIGGQARSSEQTAVASADRVNAAFDLVGKQIVLPYANPENFVSGKTAAMTATTRTAVVAAAGSGVRNYITSFTFANSHASVGTEIVIEDGTTELFRVYVKAGESVCYTLPVPLRSTANTAINATNVTTGSNTYVSAQGYKGV